jgi:hypothetical protein
LRGYIALPGSATLPAGPPPRLFCRVRRFHPVACLALVASLVLGSQWVRDAAARAWPVPAVGRAIEAPASPPRLVDVVRLAIAPTARLERARVPADIGPALPASGFALLRAHLALPLRGPVRSDAVPLSSSILPYYPTGPPIRA